MNAFESKIYQFLSKPLTDLGYDLVNVRYLKEGGENYLRITVDKDGDMSLDDIVKINEKVSPLLDENDLLKDKYILDITSLGVEKSLHLDHLEKYINQYVDIHLSHPYKGLNNLVGTLVSVDETNVTIEYQEKARKKRVNLDRKYIDKAHLAIKF